MRAITVIDREIKNRENVVLTRFGTICEILYPRKFPAIRYFPANWIYSTAVTYKSVTQDTRILEQVYGGLYPKYTLSNIQ